MRNALVSGLDHALYGLARTHAPSGPRAAWRQTQAIARFTRHHRPPEAFVRELTGCRAPVAMLALSEAVAALADFHWPTGKGGQVSQPDWLVLYAVTRVVKPDMVVETGTGSGASATAIAAALEANGHGQVVTIDAPPGSTLRGADGVPYTAPPGQSPGWAVPERLRGRVVFVLEDVRTALPRVIREGRPSLVFLDDDHTPSHVHWEVNAVWHNLPEGGVALCDDATWAWSRCMAAFGRPPYLNCGMLAGVKK